MGLESHERLARAERLQRVGLPPASAKAYLALVELGETEARDVARLSGIPFAKVYAALDDLHARGLAHVVLDTPRRYSPKPVADYLAALRARREEELKALEREQSELAALLHVEADATADDRGTFAMVRGRRGTMKKIAQLIGRAQTEVFVLASASFPDAGAYGGALLREAAARGVATRVVAHAEQARELPGVPGVRYVGTARGAQNVAMIVADMATAFVTQLVPDDADLRQGHDVGMVTSQHGIALSLRALLDTQWNGATAHFPGAERTDARRNDSR